MHKEIAEQFEELGVEPSDEVLDKCVELCLSYRITDAVEFVEQWMAYSVSNLNGAEPTIPYLLEMERKEFANKRDKESLAASNKKKQQRSQMISSNLAHLSEASPLAIYGNPQASVGGGGGGCNSSAGGNDDDDIMDSYICKTPKAPKTAIARTPARQTGALFSPASYSPIAGTPRSQSESTGKVVYTFGNPSLVNGASWTSAKKASIAVKQTLTYNDETLTLKSKYLFDNLLDKALLAGDRVFSIGQKICKKVFGPDAVDYDLHNVDVPSQEAIKTIGTISCDYDGRLDATSTILVGSDEMRCRTVRLNFSNTKSFGIFPGQVVMVSGMNPRGDTLMVDEVVVERILTPPVQPQVDQQICFVIASGPYTNHDDLVYDPLHDLILYCKDHKPDVLIMTGPFMDADHTLIHENVVLAEPYEIFFEKMIAGIVEVLGTDTTICLVASHQDANTDSVYPTLPVAIKRSYPNVHMLPDPSIVDINGIKIGITSTDVVDHLLSYELAINAGDKIKRVVNYLFNQGSFYPLSPPSDDKMCYDSDLASKFAKIDAIPNVMILPSSQKCFIRDVNGCLAINPGRLTDTKGGTFARLIIHPKKEDGSSTNLFNYVACQVTKV